MNNKGQIVGSLIVVAIALIVGAIFLQIIAQQVGTTTDTNLIINRTLATTGKNGTAVYITDFRALSDVIVTNATGAYTLIQSGNYTVTNNVIYNGALAVRFNISADPVGLTTAMDWNISATGQPTTYIDNAGGRALAGLIIIFFALGVLVVAIYPTLKAKFD